MTDKELVWLRTKGKVGACETCLFRKPINEMNTELLPCNQYQCLVKLVKTTIAAVKENKNERKQQLLVENNTHKDDKVKNASKFNIISRQQLPVRFMNGVVDEDEINKRYVDKIFGTYHVIEFEGYELKEVAEGRKTAGNEYINYIFKCQCVRCGSIRYLTAQGLQRAKTMKGACRNCWRISDDDKRLIQWDDNKDNNK